MTLINVDLLETDKRGAQASLFLEHITAFAPSYKPGATCVYLTSGGCFEVDQTYESFKEAIEAILKLTR